MAKGKLREQLKEYQRMKPLVAIKEYFMIMVSTIPYAIVVNLRGNVEKDKIPRIAYLNKLTKLHLLTPVALSSAL